MTSPERPSPVRPVEYKGEPLDAARGPGLGCFWFQVALFVVFVILTPLTVAWGWPSEVSIALLFATIILLLFAGQTVIFLLRLVAADRREGARHAPRAAATPTVGQLEDAESGGGAHVDALGRPLAAADAEPGLPVDAAPAEAGAASAEGPAGPAPEDPGPGGPGMRE